METTVSRALLTLALSSLFLLAAQDKTGPASDPELSALQKQNAMLEEKLKLLAQQQQLENLSNPDPLASQNEKLSQRMKLMSQEQSMLRLSGARNGIRQTDGNPAHGDEASIESARTAYAALAGIAPDVAKALACGGQNVVLYGPAQSDSLLSIRTFNDQVDLLRTRLKSVLDLGAPGAPDKTGASASVFGAAALSGPVLQSVLDLIAMFQANANPGPADIPVDESGLVALVANAASAQGCRVYWPDQYAVNPFNPGSQVMLNLQTLAELNDNGGADGKAAGLQQKTQALKIELKRAETMSQALSRKLDKEQSKVTEASRKVDVLKLQIDFIAGHIKDQKNAALQEKLNRTFEKSWEELEVAVKRQMGSGLPGTLEEQGKLGEMSKRLDVLKTRTDWLSQYVRDDKDMALQDKLKRSLSAAWDQFDGAVKSLQALTAGLPQAMEPDQNEQKRWGRYSADLKELITATTAASEAYTTFRGALLDGSSGTAPLSRMLRAETLRDLTFDEKFQERAGASVVQLKVQRLTGTRTTRNEKDSFSGGVVLSFVQYEPNGMVKNSGVHTAYSPFRP